MRKARVLAVGAVLALAACGGGDDDDGGTTGPAVFATLDVSPATVTLLVNGTQALTATARDQSNGTMSGLTVTYQSSDQSKATVTAAGVVTGVAAGTATITATGTVGTVVKTKAVSVTVTTPQPTASVAAQLDSKFNPDAVAITAGGNVTWTFAALHNVTFDSGTPSGGNIPDTSTGSVTRVFPTAGTYAYHCTIHAGMSGRVLVQ